MKFTTTQLSLRKAMSIAARAVSPRSTLPVLGNILLEAKGSELRVSATNLAISINCWIRADVAEEGAITLPAKLFGDMVGRLSGKVEIATNDHTQTATLASGGYKANIKGLPAEDFPSTLMADGGDPIEIEAALLARLINKTIYAAARKEDRPVLYCAQLTMNGRLTIAATDGFRLAVNSAPLPAPVEPERVLIIQCPSLATLETVLADANPEHPAMVRFDKHGHNMAVAVTGNEQDSGILRAELITQLTDAHYPDYHAIIPKNKTTTVAVDTSRLLGAARAAKLLLNSDEPSLFLSAAPGGCFKAIAKSGLMGDSVEELEAEVQGSPIEIALDVDFLIETISRISDRQVVLEMTQNTRPVNVRGWSASPDESVNVIMPMHPDKAK